MNGVYELTLRAPGGKERRTLAWFPIPEARQDYHEKAARRGFTIANEKEIL